MRHILYGGKAIMSYTYDCEACHRRIISPTLYRCKVCSLNLCPACAKSGGSLCPWCWHDAPAKLEARKSVIQKLRVIVPISILVIPIPYPMIYAIFTGAVSLITIAIYFGYILFGILILSFLLVLNSNAAINALKTQPAENNTRTSSSRTITPITIYSERTKETNIPNATASDMANSRESTLDKQDQLNETPTEIYNPFSAPKPAKASPSSESNSPYICKYCGTVLSEKINFCQECGQKLD
jgi:hypothetical protein